MPARSDSNVSGPGTPLADVRGDWVRGLLVYGAGGSLFVAAAALAATTVLRDDTIVHRQALSVFIGMLLVAISFLGEAIFTARKRPGSKCDIWFDMFGRVCALPLSVTLVVVGIWAETSLPLPNAFVWLVYPFRDIHAGVACILVGLTVLGYNVVIWRQRRMNRNAA